MLSYMSLLKNKNLWGHLFITGSEITKRDNFNYCYCEICAIANMQSWLQTDHTSARRLQVCLFFVFFYLYSVVRTSDLII